MMSDHEYGNGNKASRTIRRPHGRVIEGRQGSFLFEVRKNVSKSRQRIDKLEMDPCPARLHAKSMRKGGLVARTGGWRLACFITMMNLTSERFC